ncbi:MAG: ribokinase, partial [Lachnospiraceae bacterium]|nr:ribokinase [Lachnospiraceae bacterium]
MEKILVIGSLNVDMVVNVDHTPVTGETILSNQMTMVPGGKGANQACALGCLGAEVTMLGAVGKDSYADMQRKSLGRAGVDVSHLVEKEGVSTGLAVVMVDCEGDNSIVVISGANMMLTPEDVDRNVDLIRQSDIVVLQLEIPLDTVCHAARMAKALGKTVILDPAPVPNVFPEELYQYVDIIKPNETELSRLTGIQNIDEEIAAAAGKLRGRGVKNVLVTLGDKGVYLDSEECG